MSALKIIVVVLLVDLSELLIQVNQSTIARLAIILFGCFFMRGRELLLLVIYGLFTVCSLTAAPPERGEWIPELVGRCRFLLFPMAVTLGLRFSSRTKVELPVVGSIVILLLAVNVGLSLLGLGMMQYGATEDGSPVAVKGAYAGGNEVSVLYALSMVFLLHRMAFKALRYGTAAVLLGVGVGLWLGTKTAVFFSLISAFSVCWLVAARLVIAVTSARLSNIKGVFGSFVLGALCMSVLFGTDLGISSRIDTLTVKISRDYAKVEDIASVTTSGRIVLAGQIGQAYAEQRTPISVFFGFGWVGGQKFYSDNQNKQVESDPIDLILAFGVLGSALIYGYWFLLLRAVIKKNERTLAVAITVMLLLSIIPGHVMYSSLAPIVLGAVIGNRLGRYKNRALPVSIKGLEPLQRRQLGEQ